MEARRQAVLQKRAEEEKAKADEEEKKTREGAERRKKEREENTSQRPLVRADSKVGTQTSAHLQCADPRFVIAR
jgi:type IV secretory pathway VirB10-like protein